MKKILTTIILIFLSLSLFADINRDLMKAAEAGDINKVRQLLNQERMLMLKIIMAGQL